ncbi:MAG: DUF354 domain-containing protein, partial [Halobacteriota archaeon]|nr:DUF354 domain-containing protein [Halobacteriota archaeon]
MRVLVNIGHPAHVHFFRNFIFEMRKKGNSVLITAQHKEIAINLMKAYNLEYEYLGEKYKGSVKKMVGTIYRDYLLQKVTKKYNPDILTGILDMYSAHVGKLNKIPSIVFTDTEHAKLANMLTFPFASTICTPSCFKDDLGKKHVKYNGYHELAYLHPNYFKPNPTVLEEIGLNERDNFIIVRFVSWQASHDIGYGGLTLENKKKAVKEFEKYGKVLITSESPLPSEFEKYRISVPPEKIHD